MPFALNQPVNELFKQKWGEKDDRLNGNQLSTSKQSHKYFVNAQQKN